MRDILGPILTNKAVNKGTACTEQGEDGSFTVVARARPLFIFNHNGSRIVLVPCTTNSSISIYILSSQDYA